MGDSGVEFSGKFSFSCNNVSNSGVSSNKDDDVNLKDSSRSLFLAKWIERWKQNHTGKMHRIYTYHFMRNANNLKALVDTLSGKIKTVDITSTPTYKAIMKLAREKIKEGNIKGDEELKERGEELKKLCKDMIEHYQSNYDDYYALDRGEVRKFHTWSSTKEPLFLSPYNLDTYSVKFDDNVINNAIGYLENAIKEYFNDDNEKDFTAIKQEIIVFKDDKNSYTDYLYSVEGVLTKSALTSYSLVLNKIALPNRSIYNSDLYGDQSEYEQNKKEAEDAYAYTINTIIDKFCETLGIERNEFATVTRNNIFNFIDYTVKRQPSEPDGPPEHLIPEISIEYFLLSDVELQTKSLQKFCIDGKLTDKTELETTGGILTLKRNVQEGEDSAEMSATMRRFIKHLITQKVDLVEYKGTDEFNKWWETLYILDDTSNSYRTNNFTDKNDCVFYDFSYDSEEGTIEVIKSANLNDINTIDYTYNGSIEVNYRVKHNEDCEIILPATYSTLQNTGSANSTFNPKLRVFARNKNEDEYFIPYEEFEKRNIKPVDQVQTEKLKKFLDENKYLFEYHELLPSFIASPASMVVGDGTSIPYSYFYIENVVSCVKEGLLFDTDIIAKKAFMFPIYPKTYQTNGTETNSISYDNHIINLDTENIDIETIFSDNIQQTYYKIFYDTFSTIKPIVEKRSVSIESEDKYTNSWLPNIQLIKPLRLMGNGQSVICVGATSYPFKFEPQKKYGVYPHSDNAWLINYQDYLRRWGDIGWVCYWTPYRTNKYYDESSKTYKELKADTVIYCPLLTDKQYENHDGFDIVISSTPLSNLKLVAGKRVLTEEQKEQGEEETYPFKDGAINHSFSQDNDIKSFYVKPCTTHLIFEYEYKEADETWLRSNWSNSCSLVVTKFTSSMTGIYIPSVDYQIYLWGDNNNEHEIAKFHTGNNLSKCIEDINKTYTHHPLMSLNARSFYSQNVTENISNILQSTHLMSHGNAFITEYTDLDNTILNNSQLQQLTAYHVKREILEKAVERLLKKLDFDLYKYAMKYGEKSNNLNGLCNTWGLEGSSQNAIYRIYNEKGEIEEVTRPFNFSAYGRTYGNKEFYNDYVGTVGEGQINPLSCISPYEATNGWGGVHGSDAHVPNSWLSACMVSEETASQPMLPAMNLVFGVNLWGKVKKTKIKNDKDEEVEVIVKNSWLTDGEKYYLFEYFCLLIETDSTKAGFRDNPSSDSVETENIKASFIFTNTATWKATIQHYVKIKKIKFTRLFDNYNENKDKHIKEGEYDPKNTTYYTMPSENYKLRVTDTTITIIEVKSGDSIEVTFEKESDLVYTVSTDMVLSQAKDENNDGRWVSLSANAQENEDSKNRLMKADSYNEGAFFPLNFGIFKKAPPLYKYQILDRGIKIYNYGIGMVTNSGLTMWEKIGYSLIAVFVVVLSVVALVFTAGAAAPAVVKTLLVVGAVLSVISAVVSCIATLGMLWGFLDMTAIESLQTFAMVLGSIGAVFSAVGALGAAVGTLATTMAVISLTSTVANVAITISNEIITKQFEEEQEELEEEQKLFRKNLEVRLDELDLGKNYLLHTSSALSTQLSLAILGVKRISDGQIQTPDEFFNSTKNIDSKIPFYKQFQFDMIENFVSSSLALY